MLAVCNQWSQHHAGCCSDVQFELSVLSLLSSPDIRSTPFNLTTRQPRFHILDTLLKCTAASVKKCLAQDLSPHLIHLTRLCHTVQHTPVAEPCTPRTDNQAHPFWHKFYFEPAHNLPTQHNSCPMRQLPAASCIKFSLDSTSHTDLRCFVICIYI